MRVEKSEEEEDIGIRRVLHVLLTVKTNEEEEEEEEEEEQGHSCLCTYVRVSCKFLLYVRPGGGGGEGRVRGGK